MRTSLGEEDRESFRVYVKLEKTFSAPQEFDSRGQHLCLLQQNELSGIPVIDRSPKPASLSYPWFTPKFTWLQHNRQLHRCLHFHVDHLRTLQDQIATCTLLKTLGWCYQDPSRRTMLEEQPSPTVCMKSRQAFVPVWLHHLSQSHFLNTWAAKISFQQKLQHHQSPKRWFIS